jgi:hypothetical protein
VDSTDVASTAVAVVLGLSVLAGYTLFVPLAAPRYLLPVIALLAIPAADGIAWLAAAPRRRAGAVLLACAFLLAGAVSQNFVLHSEITAQTVARASAAGKASHVRALGIRPPCVVGSTSVAYYLGCAAPWAGEHIHELLAHTPGGVKAWRELHLPGKPAAAWIRN